MGERGPELFCPGQSGTVISHEASRAAIAGGNTYIIDNRGTDPVLAERRTKAGILAAHASAVGMSVQVAHDRARRLAPSMA